MFAMVVNIPEVGSSEVEETPEEEAVLFAMVVNIPEVGSSDEEETPEEEAVLFAMVVNKLEENALLVALVGKYGSMPDPWGTELEL